MASTIDPTKPETGLATTASVRANFQAAKTEIEALQSGVIPSLTGVGLMLTFETVADMKAYDPLLRALMPTDALVRVGGYYAAGDGGGGTFRWADASVATPNNGTIIAPDAGTGRWLRVVETPRNYDFLWFGAKGDGIADDWDAIMATIDAAKADGVGVEFSCKDYAVSRRVVVNGSDIDPDTDITGGNTAVLSFRGQGRAPFLARFIAIPGTWLPGNAVITARNIAGKSIGSFHVDTAGLADKGVDFAWIGTFDGTPGAAAPSCENTFTDMWVENANKIGYDLDQAADCKISGLMYRGGKAAIAISMRLPGGGIWADNIVIGTGRLRVSCQNGAFPNSGFFSGVEIADAALNHINFGGSHIYPYTPRRTLAANPFTTTNASATVNVSMPGHGLVNGNFVELAGCVATNGISAAQLNTTAATPRAITYIDDDTFSIVAGTEATCTLTVTSTSNPETITALTVDGVSIIPGTQSYEAAATSNEVASALAVTIAGYSTTSGYTATVLNNVITVSGVLRRASANGDVIASSTTGGLSLVSGTFAGGVDAPASSSGAAGGTTVAITGRGWSIYSSAASGDSPRSLEITSAYFNTLGVAGQKHFAGRWLNGARFHGCRFGGNAGNTTTPDVFFDATQWTTAGASGTLPLFGFDNCGYSQGRPVSVPGKVLVAIEDYYDGPTNTSVQLFERPGPVNFSTNAYDKPLRLNGAYLWDDATTNRVLRTKASAPASATDGNVLLQRQVGSAAPNTVVTPLFSAATFWDSVGLRIWFAYNAGITNWTEFARRRDGSGSPIGAITATQAGSVYSDTSGAGKSWVSRAANNTDWDPIPRTFTGSMTKDWGSIVVGASAPPQTVTVTGAVLGDFAQASMNIDLQGLTMTAYVSAADTVTVVLANLTAGAVDLVSGTLNVRVMRT